MPDINIKRDDNWTFDSSGLECYSPPPPRHQNLDWGPIIINYVTQGGGAVRGLV